MNKNEQFVIAINRELGSGGRTIGRKLAEKLGVKFYDKALIRELQKKFHLTVEEIEKLKGQKQGWWADFGRIMRIGEIDVYTYEAKMGQEPELITTDDIFKAETEILKGIAETESCVITGRCGFFVFRNHPNHINIFIQAPMEYRVERVARKQNMTPEEARKTIDKIDKMRENYVKKYTKTSRYDTKNYQLVISAEGKTEDEMVDLILDYIG